MTFTYFPNVPNAPNDPADDQPQMLTNTASISSLINVDHIGFNTPNGGWHKVVHLQNQTLDPTTTPGAGIIYSKLTNVPTSDRQLFYKTPGGGIQQLSGSRALTNGIFFASGIRVMWGQIASPVSGDNAVSFSPAFTTQCYNVQLTLERASANVDAVVIKTGTLTTSGFTAISPSGGSASIFWVAIGV